MPIRGKQLEDGTITEDKLATALKAALIFADGSNAFTGNADLGGFKIINVGAPTASGDAARYDDLQVVLAQANQFRSVLCTGYVGNATVITLNGLSPSDGDAYVVTSIGTLTAGSLGVTTGDVVQYKVTGAAWVKLASAVGGVVPAGTRLVAATTTTLISPLTNATDKGKVADFAGVVNTPALSSPSDGEALIIGGNNAVGENTLYVYNGVVPSGQWVTAKATVSPDGDSIYVSAAGVKSGVQKIETSTSANTTGDAQDTGVDIAGNPAGDCAPAVFVNGVQVRVATSAGEKTTSDAYFSVDGGATARASSSIVAGDSLYWNGVVAGYNLATADKLAIIYSAII